MSKTEPPVSRIILDFRNTMRCPGFRFHPTDEELIGFHLKRKVIGRSPWRQIIAEIDLYRLEPWDVSNLSILQGGDKEYYFFTALDKKYGHGSRTNRTTPDGYWKITGKDHLIYIGSRLAGARKALVYHFGRAPHGDRTNWVMHEFRLEGEEVDRAAASEEVFVLCRIFEKSGAGPKNGEQYGAPFVEEEWEDDRFLLSLPMIENTNGASGSGDHDYSNLQSDDDRFLLPVSMRENNNGDSGSGDHDNSNLQPDHHVQIQATLPVEQMDQPDTGNSSDLDHVELADTFQEQQNVAHVPQPCFDGPQFPAGQNFEDIYGNANCLSQEIALSNGNYVELNDFGAIAEQVSFDYYPIERVDADPIYYDARSSYNDLPMDHSTFVELNDLDDDPTETYSPGLDLVDEYLNNFDAADNNLEQYLASLDSVSSSTPRQEPDVVDPSIQTPHAPKESAIEGASSSKRKATSFYDAVEDKLADLGDKEDFDVSWGKLAKHLRGMLGSIPSPPAFAAEDPFKRNVKFVGQSSGTPLPGSVHVETRMFYMSGFTLASDSTKLCPLQKADGYLLGYSTEHLVSNSVTMPEKARLGMFGSEFFLGFLWVLLLAVSYKVGLFVCAR
ncbi:NAC domain-containing protein 78-like isoform X2 [Aristolochia californica]|uniref:NAC domain-containing protein 78-like isoform X2 n=1 Tax=Aristolochia californica TaxID=171875 RepID=UPI0035DC6C97